MSEKFLPFAVPDIGQEEIEAVVEALRSGWITTGPKVREFERAFSAALGGCVEAVAVNSATAGLHLALDAIGIGPGDEVITTTHTFTATAEVVRYLGADVRFVDIDPDTYCLDPEGLERAITERTKAVIPVHFGGLPCDMRRIESIAKRNDLKIVEDAAHAFPAWCHDRMVGTLDTNATVFSFYATKTIATGEGGMLVTGSKDVADRARIMRLHGIDRDAFDRYTAKTPSWMYQVVAPGYKYNMTDLAAALGIEQLKKGDRFLRRRTELAERYDKELADLPIRLPPRGTGNARHAWHLYVISLKEEARVSREEAISRLYDLGIGCSVHYVPLHLHPYWRVRYELSPEQFPCSQKLYERCISLPIYTKMDDTDQTRVIQAMRSIFAR